MYYRKTYIPRPSDYNRKGRLSNEAILQILEDVAGSHSASSGNSIAEAIRTNISWILTEWHVQIVRRPENEELLNITTWARGKAPASMVFRGFIVIDKDGFEVIRAEARFSLFDLTTSRLTRISEEFFASYSPEERLIFENSPKLRAPSEYDSETKIQLRRSDIDFNGHVHNTRYIDYAMQALPKELYDKDSFSEIRIIYRKPVMEDDDVTLKYRYADSAANVGIYANNTLCCHVVFS